MVGYDSKYCIYPTQNTILQVSSVSFWCFFWGFLEVLLAPFNDASVMGGAHFITLLTCVKSLLSSTLSTKYEYNFLSFVLGMHKNFDLATHCIVGLGRVVKIGPQEQSRSRYKIFRTHLFSWPTQGLLNLNWHSSVYTVFLTSLQTNYHTIMVSNGFSYNLCTDEESYVYNPFIYHITCNATG